MVGNQAQNANLEPVDKKGKTPSERFTEMVMKQYGSVGGAPYEFTAREKQLIRNYFVVIDQMLKTAEAERIRKNATNKDHSYDNPLEYKWDNLDLVQLAQDLQHYARVGLDMMEDNSLFPIPYKNNKADRYTMTLMEGYNGIKQMAVKYALEPFKSYAVEVVYSNDKFRVIKKDSRNQVESYEFEVTNPFDRGEIKGVFGYLAYEDPTKNKLVVFSKTDVEKRRPKKASAEFWGGEKTTWVNGKAQKTILEGWVPEMYEKTMKRELFGSKHVPRDPAKIDESYQYIRQRETEYADMAIEAEVVEHENGEPVELPEPERLPSTETAPATAPTEQIDPQTGEITGQEPEADPGF